MKFKVGNQLIYKYQSEGLVRVLSLGIVVKCYPEQMQYEIKYQDGYIRNNGQFFIEDNHRVCLDPNTIMKELL